MSKITGDFKGEIPIGVDVDANIAEAREYSKTHGPVDTLKWLRNKIGNGKEWDYKQLDAEESKKENRPNKYENFGNWHYGVITKSLGIPESVALSAAGGAQAAAHSGWNFELASVLDFMAGLNSGARGEYPRGYHGILDDPKGRKQILDGFDSYNKSYGNLSNPQIERMFDDLKDSLDALSFGFNPFDPRWQGKDPNWLEDIKDYWKDFFNPTADPELYDPLTLDLNNDGKISTLNLSNGVYFDHNSDGISFKTSWVGKEDGILVLDKNSNNQIDNGNELFGNFTKIEETKFAINGYHALYLQDSNNDGKIDSLDENFSKLKIWQDLNSDGISTNQGIKRVNEIHFYEGELDLNNMANKDNLNNKSNFKNSNLYLNLVV